MFINYQSSIITQVMDKTNLSRRTFLHQSALTVAGLPFASSLNIGNLNHPATALKPLQITGVNSNFEREPLLKPFGFKGGAITNVWQSIAMLENEAGTQKMGLGTQSVLWSDSKVFAAHSENGCRTSRSSGEPASFQRSTIPRSSAAMCSRF